MAYDYTNYSFEQLHAEITQKLIAQSEWVDIGDSSNTQTLIQLLAYTVDKLHYMLERRTQESFMPTAILPTSVKALASTVGYLPRRKVSAEGTLGLTIVDNLGAPLLPAGNIVIPKHTVILFDDSSFITVDEYVVTPSETFPVTINVIEGELVTLAIDINDTNGTLSKYAYVEITDYEDIEENSIEVFTDSQTFNNVLKSVGNEPPVESLEFAEVDDVVYDVKITHNGMRILVGDGSNGVKPIGSTLYIKYIQSNGADVSVSELGKSFNFETDLLEDDIVVLPKNTYRYTMTNTSTIDGGIAEETLEDIKRNAPNFARTGNRAVTKFDYEFWVKKSGIAGIVDAASYSEQEVGYNVFNMNNVYVSYLKNDGTGLSVAEKQEMVTYMDRYKSVTAHVVYLESNAIDLQIALTAKKHLDVPLSNSEFYEALRTALIDYFAYADGSLGKSIYLSSLMRYLTDYTVTKNGVDRLIVDFVDIVMKALYPVSSPIITQSIDAVITRNITGDDYVFVVNGTPYTYTQQAGDTTHGALATNIQLYLDGNVVVGGSPNVPIGEKIDAQVLGNVVTIATTEAGVPFSINNTGTTVLSNNYIEQTLQIPTSVVQSTPTVEYLKRGSVELLSDAGAVLYTDDGLGNFGTGTINYTTGTILHNILPDGNYYIRYNFLSVNSFIASKRDVFTYSLPKASFYDVTEARSTITIVEE